MNSDRHATAVTAKPPPPGPSGRTGVPAGKQWRSAAACRAADPDPFFPISPAGPSHRQITQARAICAGCPVRAECLAFALATSQLYGIWGGTTEEQRQRLRSRPPARTRQPLTQPA